MQTILSDFQEEIPITDKEEKMLCIREGDYELSLRGFSEWLDALNEMEIARIKIQLANIIDSISPKAVLTEQKYPSWLSRAADIIIFALLVTYPKGMTKEELSQIADMKETSMTTYLTSKEKGIAEHLPKKEDDSYSILTTSLKWSIDQLKFQKEGKK